MMQSMPRDMRHLRGEPAILAKPKECANLDNHTGESHYKKHVRPSQGIKRHQPFRFIVSVHAHFSFCDVIIAKDGFPNNHAFGKSYMTF